MTKTRTVYRDGIEEIAISDVTCFKTRAGHVVEHYKTADGDRYFATIKGTHFCAHGNTVAEAVADALWKDEENRPERALLASKIKKQKDTIKITLNEFRHLTGACKTGCMIALKAAGLDKVNPLAFTISEIKEKISPEWGKKLEQIINQQ